MWVKGLETMLSGVLVSGTLYIELPGGGRLALGDGTGEPVTVRIADRVTLRRLVLDPELALGEAYTEGTFTIENDDLRGFLALMLRNLSSDRQIWWQRALTRLRTALRPVAQRNIGIRSRRNVAHHYDLSGRLYDLFLDTDRQYSCAYFLAPEDGLEVAQTQKKDHIARKLRLEPGMRVLDIGCGWGGMALTLARDWGVTVHGVTLSTEQLAVARQRAAAEGLSHRVEFSLTDYRAVEGPFDRIVSVGMFEHVGLPHFRSYFGKVRDLLTPDGIALIHTIGQLTPPAATNPWIAKYIFPGGYIPSLSEFSAAIELEDLWIADVEVLRLHYAETLRHWYERFTARADEAGRLYDARFVRMWKFYLAACEQAFRHQKQAVFQAQLSRRIDAVPLTRDYLHEPAPAALFRGAAE